VRATLRGRPRFVFRNSILDRRHRTGVFFDARAAVNEPAIVSPRMTAGMSVRMSANNERRSAPSEFVDMGKAPAVQVSTTDTSSGSDNANVAEGT
jgi:hypothetical protein